MNGKNYLDHVTLRASNHVTLRASNHVTLRESNLIFLYVFLLSKGGNI